MSKKKAIKKILSKASKKAIILRHYSKRISFKNKTPKKRIIICFDGLFPHGGLVDRLKGIVSFYEIAKLLDYDFHIQFDNPFHLETFLEPNEVQWGIAKDDVKWQPGKTKFFYLVNEFNINPLELIRKSNAETCIVYANIDYFPSLYKGLKEDLLEHKWRSSFNELFKKTELLNSKLHGMESEKYIAFHTRFTSLMGDFTDSSVKSISESEKQKLLDALEVEVHKITSNSELKCYAFSDSVRFLEYIKAKEEVALVEGNPFHMDNYKGGSTLEAHLKTMLDFFMIANSEVVYFLKVSPMYHSSFSKYAAIIGNKPFKIISA